MNGKMSKRLRKLAKAEMAGNASAVDRELVLARVKNSDRVINEPMSVRAFYRALKDAYSESVHSGVAKTPQTATE